MRAYYDYQTSVKRKSKHRIRVKNTKLNIDILIGYFATEAEAKAVEKSVNKMIKIFNIGDRK